MRYNGNSIHHLVRIFNPIIERAREIDRSVGTVAVPRVTRPFPETIENAFSIFFRFTYWKFTIRTMFFLSFKIDIEIRFRLGRLAGLSKRQLVFVSFYPNRNARGPRNTKNQSNRFVVVVRFESNKKKFKKIHLSRSCLFVNSKFRATRFSRIIITVASDVRGIFFFCLVSARVRFHKTCRHDAPQTRDRIDDTRVVCY